MGSLSKVQQQLIVGCVLGDGYMRKKVNAHLQITHSIKQKEYVDWKYANLRNIVLTPPKVYMGNAKRIGYRFFTRSLPCLTTFYDMFYRKGVKMVPENLILSPLSLAVWYMDDGSKSRKASYLNCQQFDPISQSNLLETLARIGILASLNKDKTYSRIYISYSYTPILVNMIKRYIVPSMRYKLSI